ncbi:MAG: hypothetical protein AAB871_03785, partial [Patescibacteria group bacterium]
MIPLFSWLKKVFGITSPQPDPSTILTKQLNALSPSEAFREGGMSHSEFKDIYAGKVTAYEKHPNADRLRVVKVDLGDRVIEPIVCGASNFEVGDM